MGSTLRGSREADLLPAGKLSHRSAQAAGRAGRVRTPGRPAAKRHLTSSLPCCVGMSSAMSKHPVVVRRLLRDRLHDVPMLDDLAVLQPEDVDDGHAAVAGLAHAVHMQDHVVALGEGALDFALGTGELLLAHRDEALQAL